MAHLVCDDFVLFWTNRVVWTAGEDVLDHPKGQWIGQLDSDWQSRVEKLGDREMSLQYWVLEKKAGLEWMSGSRV
jgi:hypothetical protein